MGQSQIAEAVAAVAGTITLGGDLSVNRMGFGAMRITGKGVWGERSCVWYTCSLVQH